MEKPTEVAALLLCPLHLQLLDDPVLCPCGHTFCRNCILAEIARTGKCPFDGTALQPTGIFPNQLVAEEVAAFIQNGGSLSPARKPVHCSFESYGCEWKGPAEALSTHLLSCDYDKMKDFILRKERETSQLREEVRSKEQQIADLQQLLAANSSLTVDLQRILKLAMSLVVQGKTAVERSVGQVVGGIAQGWATVTNDQTYKDLSLSLEHTAAQCAASVKNVLATIHQASQRISDAEILAKLFAQTAAWKVKLAQTLEDIRETFARISLLPPAESADEKELREATRESLRSYLREVQQLNEAQEKEQTDLVQGVLASLPPPPTMPPPVPSSASGSTASGTSSSTSVSSEPEQEDDADGFVDIARRPLPDLPSAQLRI